MFRWTWHGCTQEETRGGAVQEGERYEVRSTLIERIPAARGACLRHLAIQVRLLCDSISRLEYGTSEQGYNPRASGLDIG
jgi:hypothetical protein